MHELGCDALLAGEDVRVDAHLDQVLGLNRARELGVDHLVRTGAGRGRPVDAQQEVGVAVPSTV